MLYIVVRGRWCNIVFLNVHGTGEEKSDVSKDSFYEELGQICYNFSKHHVKIMLGDTNTKVGRENIFKPKIWMRVKIRIIMIMMLG